MLPKIKINRQELAGAFGDIGTDFPLVVGLILAAKLDTASALIMFGIMQIGSGLVYKLPMAVQPLKAAAVIVITQNISGQILFGGGLAIGIAMLILTLTGALNWLGKVIPKSVIRGIQFGLGVQLALLALKDYISSNGIIGYSLAFLGFIIILFFLNHHKYPAALLIIALGIISALIFNPDKLDILSGLSFRLPQFHLPTANNIWLGFLLLALPQIPLSVGNSVLATRQVSEDLFPQTPITIKKIGITYSLMNMVNPFFSGIPTCHGSGGMVGHYTFGGRTGGSVVIYGSLYLVLGLFFSPAFSQIVNLFPLPLLGVILFFESLGLMLLVRDLAENKSTFFLAILVGLMAVGLPYGFIIALSSGVLLNFLIQKKKIILP